jgi:hypothetical protein
MVPLEREDSISEDSISQEGTLIVVNIDLPYLSLPSLPLPPTNEAMFLKRGVTVLLLSF